MADIPSFHDTLRQALAGVDNDDVRVFYDYFDELKRKARAALHQRARTHPGESAVAHSALLSLFADVALARIPLTDVDEYGKPMLWPLLLKYVERHCDKWNKYYLAKKRRGPVVSLAADADPAIDPADYRADAAEEEAFTAALDELAAKLSAEDLEIVKGRLSGETLAEIARRIGRSEATVSNRLARIRGLLASA